MVRSERVTAVAYPIQGLIKYHGLTDAVRRIPFHGSMSLCTQPTATRTTVQIHDGADEIEIDGSPASPRAFERAKSVLDAARAVAETSQGFRVVSRSNFPQHVGLGSSASGFAALAKAAATALELPLDDGEISELARMGAGSACRSVTGGLSEWITRGSRSFGRCLAEPGELDWAIVAVLVHHPVPTEGVHQSAKSSPYFRARVAAMPERLERARNAIQAKDSVALMAMAEQDTLDLHAVTMTSSDGLIAWRGETVEVIHRVRRMREEGIPAYFSIDTGATVYVNTLSEHRDEVKRALGAQVEAGRLLDLEVAPAAHTVEDHLF